MQMVQQQKYNFSAEDLKYEENEDRCATLPHKVPRLLKVSQRHMS